MQQPVSLAQQRGGTNSSRRSPLSASSMKAWTEAGTAGGPLPGARERASSRTWHTCTDDGMKPRHLTQTFIALPNLHSSCLRLWPSSPPPPMPPPPPLHPPTPPSLGPAHYPSPTTLPEKPLAFGQSLSSAYVALHGGVCLLPGVRPHGVLPSRSRAQGSAPAASSSAAEAAAPESERRWKSQRAAFCGEALCACREGAGNW
jgi:hypothetical protein